MKAYTVKEDGELIMDGASGKDVEREIGLASNNVPYYLDKLYHSNGRVYEIRVANAVNTDKDIHMPQKWQDDWNEACKCFHGIAEGTHHIVGTYIKGKYRHYTEAK